jgi:hypothetical protein
MASAFSQYLPHFAGTALSSLDILERVKPLGSTASEKRDGDAIAEAEARGRDEGREAARIEFEKARAEDQADFEFRLAEQKQLWVEETAAAIAAQIDGGLAQIETSVSGQVADVLARFLERAVEQRALSELAQLVGAAMAEGTAVRIRIAGPEALLAQLRRQPAARAGAIEYSVAADKAEVSVAIGDTILETQLAAWGERIMAAVAGESHV